MTQEPRSRQLVRVARRLIYLAVVLGVMIFFIRYDVVTIPDDYVHLAPQHMSPGTRVVLVDCDEDTVLGIGSVVVFDPPGFPGQSCWGVVAGLPGEALTVDIQSDGMANIVIGGRKELLLVTEDWQLSSGVIPDGQFVLLAGDRHLRVPSTFPDSRRLGPIARDRIVSKVVTPLSFF